MRTRNNVDVIWRVVLVDPENGGAPSVWHANVDHLLLRVDRKAEFVGSIHNDKEHVHRKKPFATLEEAQAWCERQVERQLLS